MTADNYELLVEIMRANAYMQPRNIVIRYRALIGTTISGEIPTGVTMREMFQAVVAADSRDSEADTMARFASE
jgi:hypothetical protein